MRLKNILTSSHERKSQAYLVVAHIDYVEYLVSCLLLQLRIYVKWKVRREGRGMPAVKGERWEECCKHYSFPSTSYCRFTDLNSFQIYVQIFTKLPPTGHTPREYLKAKKTNESKKRRLFFYTQSRKGALEESRFFSREPHKAEFLQLKILETGFLVVL